MQIDLTADEIRALIARIELPNPVARPLPLCTLYGKLLGLQFEARELSREPAAAPTPVAPVASASNPDADGFFRWTVEIQVHETWVEDGADFTDNRLHDMLVRRFGWATGNELRARVLTRPDDAAVATAMGYPTVAQYLHHRDGKS
jgi:hypothetical protein